jgi:hypothetical protein
MKVKMKVTSADVQVGAVKINSISSSAIVIFGDAESFYPRNVSITRGIRAPRFVPAGGGGPVGAIR